MGCCFSRATTQNPRSPNQNVLKNKQPPHLRSSPPKSNPTHEEATPSSPPPLEEESVKEVLSETPISRPHQVPILVPETNTQMPSVQKPAEKFETKGPIEEEVSEVVSLSQLSEVCSVSVSESFSAATTATTATVTEKRELREDEATSKQCSREGTGTHKWDRSPSRKRPHAADGNSGGGRERRVKSPARRPEPSPEKKVKSGSRLVRGREYGAVGNRRLNAGSAGVRRDSGEGSGRRSRSPSCTRKAGGTSKVGVGGGRKEVLPAANGVEKEKEKKSESEEVEEKNDIVSQGESIENPHVSMECFIFL